MAASIWIWSRRRRWRLRYAYDFAGADHLLFGSDHPWVDISVFIKLIEGLDIPAEDKAIIFGGNAQRLFEIS